MDISETTAPDSTQINAEDFFGGPKTLTIAGVGKGSAEQPVDIELVEITDRVYRPSKSMRRVLVNAWGPDSSAYVGRSMTLYRDPDVTFGRDKVGGIKISHLSHIDKRITVPLTVARGRRAPFSVEPLSAPNPNAKQIAALRAEWHEADADRRKEITAEVAALSSGGTDA